MAPLCAQARRGGVQAPPHPGRTSATSVPKPRKGSDGLGVSRTEEGAYPGALHVDPRRGAVSCTTFLCLPIACCTLPTTRCALPWG